MSIIQSLRDRAAWIISGAIAFALIVFVVEEGLRNKSIFGSSNTTLGSVNGKNIDVQEFEQRFKLLESRFTASMGYAMDENTSTQQRTNLWNEYVDDIVLAKVYDELGLEVTDKELGDFLYGANPPQDLRQRFTDPNTGVYDGNQAYQQIQRIKKNKNTPEYNSFFGEYMPALVKFRKREKYEALITNSYYSPKWLAEKTTNDNSQIASISYVAIPYSTIADSSIQVSDADITAYVSKNKAAFKQEKAAAIDYVFFSGAPSSTDTTAVLQQLEALAPNFASTTDMAGYLQTESTLSPFYDSYITRKKIQIQNIDSIVKLPVGQIYGPYMDGGSLVLARLLGARQIPDSVNVRHILVATMQQDPQTGQTFAVRTDETAKKLIDSIETAIKGGASFDTLCKKYSDDGTREKGGKYEKVEPGTMVAEFNDFIFTNSTGSKGVVKTQFGYHYVEILSQKGGSPAFKIAYLSKQILTSDETANNALGLATQFSAESRNKKLFEENAKKSGYNILKSDDIKPLDPNVNGIAGNGRQLIRWIFNDASVGDVAERPYEIGGNYIVPMVAKIYEEGTKNAEKARPEAEFKIRQEKKAAQIAQKTGDASSLDQVAKTNGTQVFQADSVSFANPSIANVGFEPKVSGAAFNKANQTKVSSSIAGELGVFYIKTNKVAATANANMDLKSQQQMQQQQFRMFSQRVLFDNIRKAADIKDNRYKFF